jgi:hypothetical protein
LPMMAALAMVDTNAPWLPLPESFNSSLVRFWGGMYGPRNVSTGTVRCTHQHEDATNTIKTIRQTLSINSSCRMLFFPRSCQQRRSETPLTVSWPCSDTVLDEFAIQSL